VPEVPVPDELEPDVPEPAEPVVVPEPMTGSTAVDAALTLPATSVAFAVRTCEPPDSADVVTLHAPLELVVAVPT